ncbi:hypothetical protein BCR44DRAFT_1445845 [Catenaria anguillulae PL171]|uniref:Uncharacterized protein n=1 Tax=Catenaria anguillulae PL171 TaxID=765915 RepID=A0A1Y2H6Q1_9FUNG|nr:hypothetical protein BCR44DRAFT_1445845 [Catenaria anguillulae PL171]
MCLYHTFLASTTSTSKQPSSHSQAHLGVASHHRTHARSLPTSSLTHHSRQLPCRMTLIDTCISTQIARTCRYKRLLLQRQRMWWLLCGSAAPSYGVLFTRCGSRYSNEPSVSTASDSMSKLKELTRTGNKGGVCWMRKEIMTSNKSMRTRTFRTENVVVVDSGYGLDCATLDVEQVCSR